MNALYILGMDVLAHIVSYINDPRDLKSLYVVDPWLLKNILKRCVTTLYINPEDIIHVSPSVFNMCPKITSARCDIKFSSIPELKDFLDEYYDVSQICIRISSKNTNSMFTVLCDLIFSNYIEDNCCYRLERYNTNYKLLENIWIGKGKLCLSTVNIFSFIYLYNEYLTELMLDSAFWEYDEFLETIKTLPCLKTISYPEYGFYPASNLALYNMLTINDDIKTIKSIPTQYIYEIDNYIIWDEIDAFLISCVGEVFPKLETLYLPIAYLGYERIIDEIFPNLKNIGFRYICEIKDIDGEINLDENSITLFKWIYRKYFTKFKKIKVYLYLSFPNIKDRQIINRDPGLERIISLKISSFLKNYSNNIEVHNTYCKKELIRTLDDWLFET